MFDITTVLGDTLPEITIVDIGAMDIGGEMPFQSLLDRGLARLIGFEPVTEECEKLNGQAAANMRYVPNFIADGSVRPFYLTRTSMSSSLYEPNTPFLDHFQNLEPYMQVAQTINVQTRRLDDIAEIGDVDLLKSDVDGAELDVFQGASRVLRDALVVQTEVHFVPLYKNAPLFAEIDQYLRECGYLFHTLLGHAGRAFKPLVITGQPFRGVNQWLWADAVYVKCFENFAQLSDEKLLKLAVILHEAYRSYDLCAVALQEYELRNGRPVGQQYVNRLLNASPAAA